jgi:hypothetical protein
LSTAETLFVMIYRGAPPRLWSRMLAAWLIKNVGWGSGVTLALAERAIRASAGPRPRLAI